MVGVPVARNMYAIQVVWHTTFVIEPFIGRNAEFNGAGVRSTPAPHSGELQPPPRGR